MRSARLDLTIEQGSTFTYELCWRGGDGAVKDLTDGWSARLQARQNTASTETLISLTSEESGGIVLDDANPNIVLTISADDTAELDFTQGVYDLELEDENGAVTRLLRGKLYLSREVTRTEEEA